MHGVAPFACFNCHTTFKRPGKSPGFIRLCPHCGHTAYQMGARFHAPRKSNQVLWNVIHYLAKHGFYYQEIHNLHGCIWEQIRYPNNLAEARTFVKHFCDQEIRTLADSPSSADNTPDKMPYALHQAQDLR